MTDTLRNSPGCLGGKTILLAAIVILIYVIL